MGDTFQIKMRPKYVDHEGNKYICVCLRLSDEMKISKVS